jgi:hypothetical protein
MDKKATIGPPGGRPRKDTRKLRDQWLKARVTTDEKHRAEQLMRDAGKTESDLVRDAVLEGRIVIRRFLTVEPIVLHDLGRLAQELARAGNVVNQVATVAHTTGNLRRGQMLDAAVADLNQLTAEIRLQLKRLHELE